MSRAADYYPFGLAIKDRQIEREFYRHGYQGQYAEKDEETGWNHFQLREYDPEIGKFNYYRSSQAVQFSLYLVGNNPIRGTDPTGGLSPIFSSENGSFLGLDKDGWEGPYLFYE